MSGNFFDLAENWVAGHQSLVVLLGVPLLTFGITFVAGRSSERRAMINNEIERELQRKLKLADFRQNWIDDQRADLSEFFAECGSLDTGEEQTHRIAALMGRIQMRMSRDDALYDKLTEGMLDLFKADGVGDKAEAQFKLTEIGQDILKTEWDRLKRELQIIEERK